MPASRDKFLRLLLEAEGMPYLWGAKGRALAAADLDAAVWPWLKGRALPTWGPLAFDCSGLVTWAYHAAGSPDWRAYHNTDRLLLELPAVEHPSPGTLCLYGPGPRDANHAMVWLTPSLVIGASGGNSDTTTLAKAKEHGARVRTRPGHLYRPDFLGYRALPFA